MFIVTFNADRGITGLWDRSLVEWANNVECTKENYVDGHGYTKTRYKIKCFHEDHETYRDAPVYIVDPNQSRDHWTHFVIRDSRTGHIFKPSGFK